MLSFLLNSGFIKPHNKRLFTGVIISAFLLFSFTAKSQSEKYSFAPSDSGFIMEISRSKGDVIISLTFNDSIVFDYVAIERKAEFNGEFSQCKYIPYSEIKNGNRHLVKKDIYAYSGSSDVLYRLKFVSKDGAMRIYPAIALPAVKK